MKKILIFTFYVAVLFLPIVVSAQTGGTSADYNKLLQFLKGDGAFEKWFMEAFTKLDTTIAAQTAGSVMLGQAIGGFGAMCYLGYLGWQMQEGARPWEVTPMIRPTLIAFILIFWTQFTSLIQYPLQQLAEPGISLFENIENGANDLRVKVFQKQNQILDALIKSKADEDAKQAALNKMDDHWYDVDIDTTALTAPINEWMTRMDFKFQKLIGDLLEAIGLTILRVCTYLIFFIQKIWSYVLIILGPIAIGMSLVPGFENSLTNWVAKFININLYTFITYAIINIGQQLIMTGYQMEIDRFNLMLSDTGVIDQNMLTAYISNDGMIYTALFPVVAYIITGIGVLMTPSIADAIVSAGGAGLMSKAKAGGGAVSSGGKVVGKTAGAVASGGATAVTTAIKSSAAGSASGMVTNAMKK